MIGGLFGIFLRGLVKKNQEIEKIKSISTERGQKSEKMGDLIY